jgi:lysophospholipase L1-like esterase
MIEKKILALGDSYTIGESVHLNERWPVQLKNNLAGINSNTYSLEIIAKTGWTTGELINGIKNKKINNTFDLVTLLIGVNNQYRSQDLEIFRIELKELLNISIKYANYKPQNVIVVSIPDWGVTPFAKEKDSQKIATEIDLFNSVKKMEANKLGVHYVNITEISRDAINNSQLIAEDGLHPSGLMYSRWVEKIQPIAYQILSKKCINGR